MLTWHTGYPPVVDPTFPRYLLTFCTDSLRHLLVTPERVGLVLEQILHTACEQEFATAAYCFMRDRMHLLVEAQSRQSNQKRLVKRAKQASASRYTRTFGGRLWQRQGFERALGADESTLAVAKFVLEYPVRAGLASSALDFPFSGSGAYDVIDILFADTVAGTTPIHPHG